MTDKEFNGKIGIKQKGGEDLYVVIYSKVRNFLFCIYVD